MARMHSLYSLPSSQARHPSSLSSHPTRLRACLVQTTMFIGQNNPSTYCTVCHEIGVCLSRSYPHSRSMSRMRNFPIALSVRFRPFTRWRWRLPKLDLRLHCSLSQYLWVKDVVVVVVVFRDLRA